MICRWLPDSVTQEQSADLGLSFRDFPHKKFIVPSSEMSTVLASSDIAEMWRSSCCTGRFSQLNDVMLNAIITLGVIPHAGTQKWPNQKVPVKFAFIDLYIDFSLSDLKWLPKI
jgi:hypothetical protein